MDLPVLVSLGPLIERLTPRRAEPPCTAKEETWRVGRSPVHVQVEGMDRPWTFKSRLEIPLAHVTGVEADPE